MKDRRKLSRRILALMPERLRLEIMRRNVRIETAWPSPSLEIKIADNEQELESAYRLLHDSYVDAGFMSPDPTGMRVIPQHLLPQTSTVVAKWDGKVIGTISLIRDNPFGLPLEKIFDVSDRRAHGRRLAEVSSLAVDPRYRGQINRALFPLFRFIFQYARNYFGIHELVIAVNPMMVDLYLGFLCFERLVAKPKPYDFVQGAPAVGLYMNYETVSDRQRQVFAQRPEVLNLFKYWHEVPKDPRNRMPERRYHSSFDAVLTPKLLQDFFLERARFAHRLNLSEVKMLLEAYPFPAFEKILLPLQSFLSRKNLRLETQMRAEVGSQRAPAEVLNVSKEGLLLRMTADALVAGQKIHVHIWLNDISTTYLEIEVRWCPRGSSLFGTKIVASTAEWRMMVESLEREYKKLSDKFSIAA